MLSPSRPVNSQDFSWFQDFHKSLFASKFSWKKRSRHRGKKELACIVSKPLVSCLWGCGESVNPPKLNIQEVQGLCPLDQRETQARYPIFQDIFTFVKSHPCPRLTGYVSFVVLPGKANSMRRWGTLKCLKILPRRVNSYQHMARRVAASGLSIIPWSVSNLEFFNTNDEESRNRFAEAPFEIVAFRDVRYWRWVHLSILTCVVIITIEAYKITKKTCTCNMLFMLFMW